MHIETWRQLITFLQSVLPMLTPEHQYGAHYVIEWAQTHFGETTGIVSSERSNVISFLMDVRPTIPANWTDEIQEANMFLARLNSSPSGDKWHTQAGCNLWNKEWWDNACHDSVKPPVVQCSEIMNYYACIAYGCYWWNDACHEGLEPLPPLPPPPPPPPPPPKPCYEWPDQVTCLSMGCHWWNNSCHPDPAPAVPVCGDHTTEIDCLTGGCYCYNGACHNTPEIVVPGIANPMREFAKQVNEYCGTIPLSKPLELVNCGILSAILNITADVFDFLGVKK